MGDLLRGRDTIGALARIGGAFGVAVVGMLLACGALSATSWCWPAYLLVGVAAGAVAGRGRDIWLIWVAAGTFYPVAAWLGLRDGADERTWLALTLVGACLATAGFAIGALVAGGLGTVRAGGSTGPVRRAIGRPLLVSALAVGLAGLGGWTAYAAIIGSEELVASTHTWPDCGTPASVYGWSYEAVNYDVADDARLAAMYPGLKACGDFGSKAGDEVVTSDGIRIAGWYIPSASGTGARGPTIVIVPGWKSHKSEVLKYAPPFHDAYNLLLVDLRRGGRSSQSLTTWGLREQLDVRAMIDWLVRTKDPTWIGSMGNSMGAATALAEAVGDQRVKALILDSMHASIVTSFTDGLGYETHLPGIPTAAAMVAGGSLRVGADLTSVDPVKTIGLVGDRPVLLIHSRNDGLDRPEHSADLNLAAARRAGVAVDLRYCDGGWHGHVIDADACPAEWAAWATDFLAAATGR